MVANKRLVILLHSKDEHISIVRQIGHIYIHNTYTNPQMLSPVNHTYHMCSEMHFQG